jgi:hypothetical protein
VTHFLLRRSQHCTSDCTSERICSDGCSYFFLYVMYLFSVTLRSYINWQRNEWCGCALSLGYYLDDYVQGLGKLTQILSQDSRSCFRDSNLVNTQMWVTFVLCRSALPRFCLRLLCQFMSLMLYSLVNMFICYTFLYNMYEVRLWSSRNYFIALTAYWEGSPLEQLCP